MFLFSNLKSPAIFAVAGYLFVLMALTGSTCLSGDIVPAIQASSSDTGDPMDPMHPWHPLLEGQTEALIKQYQNSETAPIGLLTQSEIEDQMLAAWESREEQTARQAPRIPEPYSFVAGGLFLFFALSRRRQRPVAH